MEKFKRFLRSSSAFVLAFILALSCAGFQDGLTSYTAYAGTSTASVSSVASADNYSGSAYVEINGNVPEFTSSELTTTSFETYSDLDDLGRCGVAYACIGIDLMPTEDRDDISSVTPTGWVQVKYDGSYLYNRCHLIGYQLTAENANEKNLITGTRYLNTTGMLPFENMVADYIEETENHVMYRVTPYFEDDNLLASGVQIEAYSVEDDGEGICFNVYCYNVQPGVVIDYATGSSYAEDAVKLSTCTVKLSTTTYTYNGKTRKPSVTVTTSDGTKLTKGTDYTVTYASGRKKCGKYKVTITGIGAYKGTVTKYFKIKPAKAKTPTLTSSKAKTLKVKWTKSSGGVSGYQIAYRVKGTSTWKKVTTTSTSKTLKSLKAGKKYQVKIRAYKTINGTKVYGSWSKVVTKTVKKSSSSSSSSSSSTVYITESGTKYHKSGCKYLSSSKIKTTKAKAKAQGYEACSVCNP